MSDITEQAEELLGRMPMPKDCWEFYKDAFPVIRALLAENKELRWIAEYQGAPLKEVDDEKKELLVQREREHALILEMKDEISRLKSKNHNLQQKLSSYKGGDV